MESITVSEVFPVKAAKLYKAWLDSRMHSQMTGLTAEIDPAINGSFSIADGAYSGKTLKLKQDAEIVQSWRSAKFTAETPDSMVTVKFEPLDKGTRVSLTHSQIENGKIGKLKGFWEDTYVKPMMRFFSRGR